MPDCHRLTCSAWFQEHRSYEPGSLSITFFWTPAACFAPYIAMNSIGDYKKKAVSKLWISGLYPLLTGLGRRW
ncbi:ATP-binding cassette sub-family A member 9 [Manis javanica]|nr:ATP-binding cassette sub-family A member 9 [Manis javanica]